MAFSLAYALAAVIGGFVGVSEVLSRYRDAPWRALFSLPGLAYVAFNAGAALIALVMIEEVFPLWGPSGGATLAVVPEGGTRLGEAVANALLAGFGAMAVLRSSILTTRIGSKDIEIGPAAVIDILRHAMDRGIARQRAIDRADKVLRIMENVSFARSYDALSAISFALLGSVDAEERSDVMQEIGALASQTGRSDRDKSLELGLILSRSAGFEALEATIRTLGIGITKATTERPVFVAEQVARLPLDLVLRDLPVVCLATNLGVEEQAQADMSAQIDAISASALTDQAKRINVGLVIANILGEESLKTGVDLLSGAVGVPVAGKAPAGP